MCLVRITANVFLDCPNDLDVRYVSRNADHPVPPRHAQQLVMHRKSVRESFHPPFARRITLHALRIGASFSSSIGTNSHELHAGLADVHLLACVSPTRPLTSCLPGPLAGRCQRKIHTDHKQSQQETQAHGTLQSPTQCYALSLGQQMRPDDTDKFAGTDDFGFLPELPKMALVPGDQVGRAGGVRAFQENVIGRVGGDLERARGCREMRPVFEN